MEMNPLASELFTAIVVFVSTNIDDLFLLAAFFADPRVRYRSIVIGQYAGIGVLVVFSALVALLALAFPEGWVALLGIVPLYLASADCWRCAPQRKARKTTMTNASS